MDKEEKYLRGTRNNAGDSEVVRRGVFQSSAKRFRRAGHSDRNILRASHPFSAFREVTTVDEMSPDLRK